jgi:hypothetical protein
MVTNLESCYIDIPHLLYYSHIPTAVIALVLGFFVYFKTRGQKLLVGKILLFTTSAFALWSRLDLSLWLSMDSRSIMFSWSIINLLEMLATSGTLYFAFVFRTKRCSNKIQNYRQRPAWPVYRFYSHHHKFNRLQRFHLRGRTRTVDLLFLFPGNFIFLLAGDLSG